MCRRITLSLPNTINIHGMIKGSLANGGLEKIVAFTDDDHLLIADTKGKVEWKGGEQYGGSNISIDYPSPDGDRSVKKRIYLSHRVQYCGFGREWEKRNYCREKRGRPWPVFIQTNEVLKKVRFLGWNGIMTA